MSLIDKVVQVIFRGKDEVSPVASRASESATGFAARAAAAYAIIAKGISMVADKIGASLRSFDEMNASQRKLEGTAKLLGVSQEYLADIVSVGQQKFKLSEQTANNYAIEMAKLAKNSGDASIATQLLASFLDLGAARGLNAAESLQKAAQSIVGIDEGTDALFGKNPSSLYADFAAVIERSAGSFSDQDKAAALAYATLDAGMKVAGSYEKFLQSAAGKQEVMNQRMMEAEASFGAALQPIRLLTMELVESLMPALGPLARILGGGLAAAVVTVAKVFNILYGNVGLLVEGIGKLTKSKAMEEWGRSAAQTAAGLGAKLNEAGEAAGRAILGVENTAKQSAAEYKVVEGKRAETVAAMAKLVEDAKKREGTAHTDAAKDADKAFKDYLRAARETFEMLNKAVLSNEEVLKRLSPQLQKSYDRIHIDNARQATDALRSATDELVKSSFAGVEVTVGTWDRLRHKIREAGFTVENAARYTIDFAQSFGALDREAASALTSVVNIGSAVKLMADKGLSFAGMTGILSGVANIVSTMMQGDTERKRLLKQNNDALDNLRRDIGGLNLRITGEDLVSAQTALQSVVGQLKGGRGAANESDVRNALYAQGLSMEDFDRIAKEFGIEVRSKSGALNVDSVKAVLDALNTVQLGKVGGRFDDQLDFFRESQDLAGEAGVTRALNLLKFLAERGNVGALAGLDLSDPTALRAQLLGVRQQLNSAEGIDERQLGRLTGAQFNDLLVELVGLLATTAAAPDLGPAASAETQNRTDPVGSAAVDAMGAAGAQLPVGMGLPSLGTIDIAAGAWTTLKDVLHEQSAVVVDVLTAHTALHERVANATEGSFGQLIEVNRNLVSLIATTAGQRDRVDRDLEASRYALAVQQGQGAAF